MRWESRGHSVADSSAQGCSSPCTAVCTATRPTQSRQSSWSSPPAQLRCRVRHVAPDRRVDLVARWRARTRLPRARPRVRARRSCTCPARRRPHPSQQRPRRGRSRSATVDPRHHRGPHPDRPRVAGRTGSPRAGPRRRRATWPRLATARPLATRSAGRQGQVGRAPAAGAPRAHRGASARRLVARAGGDPHHRGRRPSGASVPGATPAPRSRDRPCRPPVGRSQARRRAGGSRHPRHPAAAPARCAARLRAVPPGLARGRVHLRGRGRASRYVVASIADHLQQLAACSTPAVL